MILFPFLYEDELLYSIIARYHQYTGNDNYKTTTDELFGSRNVCAATIFPTHLNKLSERISYSDTYTPNYFINNHTFLPYYAPFIPIERYKELREIMINSNGTAFYMKLGKTASTLKSPKHLRYCFECVNEDRNTNGETYWHRTHQVEGVKLCPKHHTWLTESSTLYSERKNKHEFISIELETLHKVSNGIKKSPIELRHLIFIAEQTNYLLNNKIPPIGLEKLNIFYVKKLQQIGLATVSGRIRWIELIPMFNRFYGDNLLYELNCFIERDKENTWLHKLLRKPRVSCHPLRHILLLGFLGEKINTLVNHYDEGIYQPFGSGPWRCLNKAAEHYKELEIFSCRVTKDYKTGLPVGTFSCSCGFVYSRKGPDKTVEDSLKVGRIKVFGLVWEQKLSELSTLDLSLRKKAEILGVDPMTVKRRLKAVNKDEVEKNTQNKTKQYREQWNEVLRSHSEKTITEIRSLNPNLYLWFYRNDRDWLQMNYPSNKKLISKNPIKRVNWDHRDLKIAKQAEHIITEILSESNKLIRVTKNEIGRRLGILASLSKNLDKLPYTKVIISQRIESIEQFQIRRVKHVINELRYSNSTIKEWEVIRAAGLNRESAKKHKKIILEEISKVLGV